MQKACAQCSANFEITDDDLAFYEKISPTFAGKTFPVPQPTQCPDCRSQRRMQFRNERTLYKRTCDATGKSILSVYAPEKPLKVYGPDAWWSDAWSPMDAGRSIDFNRPFFEQFAELYESIPHIALYNVRNENCDYVNQCGWSKDCYMAFMTDFSEGCLYTDSCMQCKSCVDSTGLKDCELCFAALNCVGCYAVEYSRDCKQCADCSFCAFCRGCKNCFGCVNLRGKQYCIFNEQKTQEEYEDFMRSVQYTPSSVRGFQGKLDDLQLQHPHPWAAMTSCEDCTGDDLSNCSNAKDCYEAKEVQDSKYLSMVPAATSDCQDMTGGAGELQYQCFSVGPGNRNIFCGHCWDGIADLLYCTFCMNGSSHCFGCVGLLHARYCIFNTQYTEEEYERLAARLIEHMQGTGEWGSFFPASMSPFAYNETVAQEHFPLTRESATARGWPWHEGTEEMPRVEKFIPASRLPEAIEDVPDDILDWAITCDQSKRPFKIIKQELEFYRQNGLPVPRLHPDERRRRRMALRNPRRLWERTCARCDKSIQTTYAPDRPETVYCESCYLAEVY